MDLAIATYEDGSTAKVEGLTCLEWREHVKSAPAPPPKEALPMQPRTKAAAKRAGKVGAGKKRGRRPKATPNDATQAQNAAKDAAKGAKGTKAKRPAGKQAADIPNKIPTAKAEAPTGEKLTVCARYGEELARFGVDVKQRAQCSLNKADNDIE